MGEGQIRFRRRRFDRLFLFILFGGVLAAGALYVWLPDLFIWLREKALPQTVALVLSGSFAIVVIFVLFGFGLPKWIGYNIRKARAEQWKIAERNKWGFYSRDREGPWINYVDYPVVKKTPIVDGKKFYAEWLMICDGMIIVNPGESMVDHTARTVTFDHSVKRAYAWDGCTPKRFFWWFMVFGTPDFWHQERTIKTIDADGRIVDRAVVWQLAHHASLVHDALYQYLEHIPLGKKDVDRLFYEMLKESGLCRPFAKIYHLAVRWFGPGPDPGVARVDNSSYVQLLPPGPGGSGHT